MISTCGQVWRRAVAARASSWADIREGRQWDIVLRVILASVCSSQCPLGEYLEYYNLSMLTIFGKSHTDHFLDVAM